MYRIMIVDDEPLSRLSLSAIIAKLEGFQVVRATGSGDDLPALCSAERIDIVFMDNTVPGSLALKTARLISEMNPKVTIFVMSRYNSFSFAREAMKLNIRDYISKPVSAQGVQQVLENFSTENKGNSSRQLEALVELVGTRDFRKVYYEVDRRASDLCAEAEYDPRRLQELLTYVGQGLLSRLYGVSNPHGLLEKRFVINAALEPMDYVTKIWLFRLVDYLFQQSTVYQCPMMEKVFFYIDKHYKGAVGLNDIAEECSISQGYLSRIFKKQFGISVMEYLHFRKLHAAKTYLYFTNSTVAEIAFLFGYNENSYFSKVFKKYENMTVQDYRKKGERERANAPGASSIMKELEAGPGSLPDAI